MSSAATTLPQSTSTLWLQSDGTYLAAPSGASGELAVVVPVTDAVCEDDLDPNGNETTSDAQALAQDVYHVILETLGSNLDDLNRGIGAQAYASGTLDALQALPAIIDSQLRKDTRLDGSRSKLTVVGTTQPPSYALTIELLANGQTIPLGLSYSPTTGLVRT